MFDLQLLPKSLTQEMPLHGHVFDGAGEDALITPLPSAYHPSISARVAAVLVDDPI
jgi:hypothetical protein